MKIKIRQLIASELGTKCKGGPSFQDFVPDILEEWLETIRASLIVHRPINFLRVYLLNLITMSSYHMVARKIMLELSSKRLT